MQLNLRVTSLAKELNLREQMYFEPHMKLLFFQESERPPWRSLQNSEHHFFFPYHVPGTGVGALCRWSLTYDYLVYTFDPRTQHGTWHTVGSSKIVSSTSSSLLLMVEKFTGDTDVNIFQRCAPIRLMESLGPDSKSYQAPRGMVQVGVGQSE